MNSKAAQPPLEAALPLAQPVPDDPFARAAARLGAQRPIRNPRLQAIVGDLQANRLEAADKALAKVLAKSPADPDALSLMARTLVRLGRREEAISVLTRCLKIAPDFSAARFNLANLLFQLFRFEAALKELDTLLAGDEGHPLFLQLKANVLEAIGEDRQALAIAERLAGDHPGRFDCWIRLGHALRALGAQDRSVAAYRQAIALRPSSGQAYWSLANMKTVRFDEAEIKAMEAQCQRADIAADDRIALQFSLGKAYEDAAAYAASFAHYDQANAALRHRIDYHPDTLTAGVAANKALYTAAFFARRSGAGCPAPDAIFILGRPRSGSTLVEQILSSHSAIEGTAELPYITSMAARLHRGKGPAAPIYSTEYLKVLAGMTPAALTALGEEYLKLARVHRKQDRPFFIDKKPANVTHVGMIHLMLPNARIIDVRRHPVASAFSMFKFYSSKGRLRLDELGRFYRDYVDLMAHFDDVLPGRIHRVIYEELVSDPEAEIRRLLDHLGLPFEPACLRFHETERSVRTPSSEQVRRPISTGAVDHWRHFEPWLAPLIDSLGSVFTAYPAVPPDLR